MKRSKNQIENNIRERLKNKFIPLFLEDGKPAEAGYHADTKIIYKDVDAIMNDYYRNNFRTKEEEKRLSEIRREESDKKELEKESIMFEKAKKIKFSEWKGDQFFDGENYLDDVCDIPADVEYVWATKKMPYITKKDASDVYSSNIEDDLDPEYDWPVDGVEELQKALDDFVEINKTNTAYWPDYDLALLI